MKTLISNIYMVALNINNHFYHGMRWIIPGFNVQFNYDFYLFKLGPAVRGMLHEARNNLLPGHWAHRKLQNIFIRKKRYCHVTKRGTTINTMTHVDIHAMIQTDIINKIYKY